MMTTGPFESNRLQFITSSSVIFVITHITVLMNRCWIHYRGQGGKVVRYRSQVVHPLHQIKKKTFSLGKREKRKSKVWAL